MLYYIILILVFIPFLIIYPTRVIGRKNLRIKGRMIFCCNHQSNNDLLLIGGKLGIRFRYMAKESLFKNKFVGTLLKWLGAYPVKRGETDIVAIKKTLGYLKDDKKVCIFPEGARLKSSEGNELKSGVIIFALKTKSPIVPAFIVKKPMIFRFNTLIIGEAFNLSEMPEFKGKKIDDDLIKLGVKYLQNRMYGLSRKYAKKNRRKN